MPACTNPSNTLFPSSSVSLLVLLTIIFDMAFLHTLVQFQPTSVHIPEPELSEVGTGLKVEQQDLKK